MAKSQSKNFGDSYKWICKENIENPPEEIELAEKRKKDYLRRRQYG